MKIGRGVAVALGVCVGLGSLLMAAAGAWGAGGDEGVSLTVYNNNFGVVREVRRVEIGEASPVLGGLKIILKGTAADAAVDVAVDVKFADVAARIDPTTVHFRSLTDPDAQLLEQNYQYDLVSADKLLRKYVDRPIEVVCEDVTYKGVLLSFDARQLILKSEAGLVMVQRADNVRDIRFGALPEGLLTRPTLLWKVATDRPGEHLTEVTYQTGGLNWHAEYVLMLADDDAAADSLAELSGWVSVENKSGKTYRDARLKFVAGDVRRITPPSQMYAESSIRGMKMAGRAPAMVEKAFFEYHMYTSPRLSTVADNETKQLEMFTPVSGLTVAKRFLYNPLSSFRYRPGGRYAERGYGATTGDTKVSVFIEFKNTKANKLGIPLPAGKVRVYKRNTDDGAAEFVGEEMIDHTAKDEELSLRIGNAFDIVGERRQVRFKLDKKRSRVTETIEIKLRNHKETDVVVRVKEPLYRWANWEITEKSAAYIELDSRTVAWDVPVRADGERVLTYTVEYRW